MQAAVNEVGGQIHQPGPRNRVRANQANILIAHQSDEFLTAKALMPNLKRMPNRAMRLDLQPCRSPQPVVVLPTQGRGRFGVVRKKLEEWLDPFRAKAKVW